MPYRHFWKFVFPVLILQTCFTRMIPEDARLHKGIETFVREFALTLCILKTNFHLYLVLTFDLPVNLRPEMLVADHYIAHMEIVSNVFNDDLLVDISYRENLAGWGIL